MSKEKNDVFREMNVGGVEGGEQVQYLVTDEFRVGGKIKELVYGLLREIEGDARGDSDVCSFWVLDRDGEALDDDGNEVYLLVRCKTKEAYETFKKRNEEMWEQISQLIDDRRTTSWVETGIGFFAS